MSQYNSTKSKKSAILHNLRVIIILGVCLIPKICHADDGYFEKDGLIYARGWSILGYWVDKITLTGYNENYFKDDINIKIPSTVTYQNQKYTVTKIRGAFEGCTRLKSIELPSTIWSIGDNSFYNCSQLQSVTIPNSVTEIGQGAFYGCAALKAIVLPESITTLEESVFENCLSLEQINIPSNVNLLKRKLFKGCKILSSIICPSNIKEIHADAFSECDGFQTITIPNTVKYLHCEAFCNCPNLHEFIIEEGKNDIVFLWSPVRSELFPNSPIEELYVGRNCKVGYIDYYSNPNYNISSSTGMPYSQTIQTIIIGGNASSYNFSRWDTLSNVKILSSITDIPEQAFMNCFKLTSIELPTSILKINSQAFYGCKSLETITIPASVSTLGWEALAGCTSLKEINYDTQNPITASKWLFSTDAGLEDNIIYDSTILNIAIGGMANVQTTSPWKYFVNIHEKDFSGIEDIIIEFDKNTPIEVYNLNGIKIADNVDNLPAGLYIFRQHNLSKKVVVQ